MACWLTSCFPHPKLLNDNTDRVRQDKDGRRGGLKKRAGNVEIRGETVSVLLKPDPNKMGSPHFEIQKGKKKKKKL